MEGKTVAETQVVMSQVMSPLDTNRAGNVHGGVIMKQVDNAGGLAALRHARSNVVTASIDRLDFLRPVYVGDVITLKASVNMAGSTSMEVGVRVETEDPLTGKQRHVASAYLTMVALDDARHPKQIPPLVLKTARDRRRNAQAITRRESRLAERKKLAAHAEESDEHPASG